MIVPESEDERSLLAARGSSIRRRRLVCNFSNLTGVYEVGMHCDLPPDASGPVGQKLNVFLSE